LRASRDVSNARRGADTHTAVVRSVDAVAVSYRSKIHDDVRLAELLGDGDEQVSPSAEWNSAGLAELLCGVVGRRCVPIEERMRHGTIDRSRFSSCSLGVHRAKKSGTIQAPHY